MGKILSEKKGYKPLNQNEKVAVSSLLFTAPPKEYIE